MFSGGPTIVSAGMAKCNLQKNRCCDATAGVWSSISASDVTEKPLDEEIRYWTALICYACALYDDPYDLADRVYKGKSNFFKGELVRFFKKRYC